MNCIQLEEASNDDTNIISDLLNSAEAMQSSSISTTNAGITTMQMQQKDELQIVQNSKEISVSFGDAKKNLLISLQHNNNSMVGSDLFNSTQYSDSEDLNKVHIRHVHIPYILNGELYKIQTQDGENVTVKCCHCPPDRVYRGSVRSTGNFHMHIKRRHPDLLEKLHEMKVNALLERRDRLMRNRKITHRNNRNRPNSNSMCSFKNEEKTELITSTPGSQITMDSTPELGLMHTHKLKIKTVFQRHQMQQREAAEMQNWNKADFVVKPIGKLQTNGETELPINYSVKSLENYETHAFIASVSSNTNQQQQEKRIPNDSTTHTSFNNFTNLNNQTEKLSTNNDMQQNEYICENYTNNRNLSLSSMSLSCPSVMSSYASSQQYEMEINRSYNSVPIHHHNLSIIKPELLLLRPETEAIDLTVHTDSGIFSNSEDSGSVQNNDFQNNKINNNCSINKNRAGSQKTNTDNIIPNDVERNGNSGNNISTNSDKWQDLLMQVENSLRDIQREMNVRNHIESNRMFLDIAKFKYLNPGFQFNW